jgi:hypothetical protein
MLTVSGRAWQPGIGRGSGMSRLVFALCVCAASALVFGCSGDDSGPNPVTSVTVTPETAVVDLGHSEDLMAEIKGGGDQGVTWYVNDIENGNEIYGTITGGAAATYSAPDYLPVPATVTVKAVSVEDTTKLGTCTLSIVFRKMFVDPESGNDTGNNGSVNLPFKSISHASREAESGMTIFALPGVYSVESGETFPIVAGADSLCIEGMDWEQCIIRGHDQVGTYNTVVALGGYDGISFRKFTLEQGLPADEVKVTLYIGGPGVHVDSIRASERAYYAVCRAENATSPFIENCEFVVSDGSMLERGINLFPDSNGGILRNCRIIGFNIGLRITGTSDLLVEGCTLEGNSKATEIRLEETPNSLNPDFGGGARGSLGGNIIRDNDECGLWFDLPHAIYAKYNTWGNDPPVQGEDYCRIGDGGLILD